MHLISRHSKGPEWRVFLLLFHHGYLINFRTRFIEHDYTACCPQFNVGSDLLLKHIGLCYSVVFAVALKADWVGQSASLTPSEISYGMTNYFPSWSD